MDERREEIIDAPGIEELKKRVYRIRENSIKNLDGLLNAVEDSFSENGVEFHIADDAKKARKIIYKIVKDEGIVAKSKSNTLSEIDIIKFLSENGVKVVETDLGDRLIQLMGDSGPVHPIGPALHFSTQEIAEKLGENMGVEIKADPREIMEAVKSQVIQELGGCKVALTGANAVAAHDGSILMVHNEGNISLLSLMDTHVILFGVDKLVRTLEEAVSVAKLETIYATGMMVPSYINIVSGPSKTADIQKILLEGMYGARRVVAIALDNGRRDAIPECLLCIGCGSCIVSCPIYNTVGYDFGHKGYLGGRGVAFTRFIDGEEASFKAGAFMCTLCSRCTIACPLEIQTPKIMEEVRFHIQRAGFTLDAHDKIKKNIQERGSALSKERYKKGF